MVAEAPEWIQALVLGLVQGLTEFIPVSSSGHLVLVPALAGWERHGLAFDVALHLGTLFALLLYYRRDLSGMVRSLASRERSPERDEYRRSVLLLALASVPVAVAGLTLDEAVEAAFAAPTTAAALLLVTAAVLVGGERLGRRHQPVTADAGRGEPGSEGRPISGAAGLARGRRGLSQALVIGIAQCFALLPGLSRSGLTISAGVAAGLSRPAATRFAFLLGLPAIGGAAVVQLPRVDDLGSVSAVELGIGVLVAGVSGYLAIALLVRLVSRSGIDRFAWYLVPLAFVALAILR